MKVFTEFVRLFNDYKLARESDIRDGTKITFKRDGLAVDEEGTLTHDFGISGDKFIQDIESSISEARIWRIDESVKKLLLLTKVPKINSDLFLPYPTIFLDISFTKEELAELGIDVSYKRIIGILFRKGNLVNKENIYVGKDLRVTAISKQENGQIWFDTFNTNVNLSNKYKDYNYKIKKCESTDPNVKKFIHHFVLAFLNFVNNPEIEIIEVKYDEKQNEKRIKKGKAPIPVSNLIRVTGTLKKYIDFLQSSGSFEYNYRFWVRGHFRTLRDEKRWKENTGKRIWIPPFIKGKGVLVEKEYRIVGGDSNGRAKPN